MLVGDVALYHLCILLGHVDKRQVVQHAADTPRVLGQLYTARARTDNTTFFHSLFTHQLPPQLPSPHTLAGFKDTTSKGKKETEGKGR